MVKFAQCDQGRCLFQSVLYPHQHTIDTQVCGRPKPREQPSLALLGLPFHLQLSIGNAPPIITHFFSLVSRPSTWSWRGLWRAFLKSRLCPGAGQWRICRRKNGTDWRPTGTRCVITPQKCLFDVTSVCQLWPCTYIHKLYFITNLRVAFDKPMSSM